MPYELRNELGWYQNCIARQSITQSHFRNDSRNFLKSSFHVFPVARKFT